MILLIDQSSSEPLYQQIRNQVVAAIARGELMPGDGLPSVRRLASDLGINLHTVNKAYAVLRDEGYLIMRGRNGAHIADVEQAASEQRREGAEAALSAELQKLALEYRARGGCEEAFVEFARNAARIVYDDPSITGTKRPIGVLGVDTNGDPIETTATRTAVARPAQEA